MILIPEDLLVQDGLMYKEAVLIVDLIKAARKYIASYGDECSFGEPHELWAVLNDAVEALDSEENK